MSYLMFNVWGSRKNKTLALATVAGQDMAETPRFAGVESRERADSRGKKIVGGIPAILRSQLKAAVIEEYKAKSQGVEK